MFQITWYWPSLTLTSLWSIDVVSTPHPGLLPSAGEYSLSLTMRVRNATTQTKHIPALCCMGFNRGPILSETPTFKSAHIAASNVDKLDGRIMFVNRILRTNCVLSIAMKCYLIWMCKTIESCTYRNLDPILQIYKFFVSRYLSLLYHCQHR